MSRERQRKADEMQGFPRMSGDEPAPTQMIRTWLTFSPHERG